MPLKRGEERNRPGTMGVPVRRCLLFSVDGTDYGIAVDHVKGSMPAPHHNESAATVHGELYPIVDARAVFGLAPSAAPGRMLLAVEAAQGRAGLVVDRVVRLAAIEETAIVPPPALFGGAERRWLEGLARADGRVVALVRPDGLVGARGRAASLPLAGARPGDR